MHYLMCFLTWHFYVTVGEIQSIAMSEVGKKEVGWNAFCMDDENRMCQRIDDKISDAEYRSKVSEIFIEFFLLM